MKKNTIQYYVLLMTWILIRSVSAQSLESYFNDLELGDEGIVSIPLSGLPSPSQNELYLTPHSEYTDLNSLQYMKTNMSKEKESLRSIYNVIQSIRMEFRQIDQTDEQQLFGHSFCFGSASGAYDRGDPLLDGVGNLPGSLKSEIYTFPIYQDKTAEDYYYVNDAYEPTASQLEVFVEKMPRNFCDDIIHHWNECDRIDVTFKTARLPEPNVYQHGISENNGSEVSKAYHLYYTGHVVVCPN